MHPVIRVSLFLVFAVSVSRLLVPQFFLAALILLTMLMFNTPVRWALLVKSLRRLRWFYLTILLLYGWLTPGQAISSLPVIQNLTLQGIQAGLLQVTSLMFMVTALILLLGQLARDKLIGAIFWWSYPLQWIKISRERLVLRLMLTMDAVQSLQQQLTKPTTTAERRWQKIADLLLTTMQQTEQSALQTASKEITIQTLPAPPLWQWCYPVLIIVLFQVSQHVVPPVSQW